MPLCYWNHFLQLWDDQLLQKLSSAIFHLCLNIFRHPSRKWNHSLKTSNQFRLKLLFLLWADSSKRLGPAPPHSWLSHCGASLVLAIILRPTHVITKKKLFCFSKNHPHCAVLIYCGSKRVLNKNAAGHFYPSVGLPAGKRREPTISHASGTKVKPLTLSRSGSFI